MTEIGGGAAGMLVVGLMAGVVIGAGLALWLSGRYLLLRSLPATSEKGALRHTIDHRCEPPDSSWSSFDDDVCYVKIGAKHVRPGDVWVCPGCLTPWHTKDGEWIPDKTEALP